MVKVIETNVLKCGDMISDHQSRVGEYLSWRDYKKQFIYYGDIPRKAPISCLGPDGYIIPAGARITKLSHNRYKLYCEFNTEFNDCILMAYLIEED